MEYNYDVVMQTQLGNRIGKLSVSKKQKKVKGFLYILGYNNSLTGRVEENGMYELTGELVTLARTIPFLAEGYVDEKSVNLTLHCPNNTFYIAGKAIENVREGD